MSDEPPDHPASLSTGTIVAMILLVVSIPLWVILLMLMMSAEHTRASSFWLGIRIGWLYPPAVVLGFVHVFRRRSPAGGQCVELLLPPSIVVLVLSLLSLFESWFGRG